MDPPWLGCPCCDSPMYHMSGATSDGNHSKCRVIYTGIQASFGSSDWTFGWLQVRHKIQDACWGFDLRSYKFRFARVFNWLGIVYENFWRSKPWYSQLQNPVTWPWKMPVRGYQKHHKTSLGSIKAIWCCLGSSVWSWQDCKRFQSCTRQEEQAFEWTFQLFPEHMNQASDRYSTRAKHATERQKFLANRHPDRVKRMKVLPAKQKAHLFLLPGPGPRAGAAYQISFWWRLQELSQVLNGSSASINVQHRSWMKQKDGFANGVCPCATRCAMASQASIPITCPVHPCPPGISVGNYRSLPFPHLGVSPKRLPVFV